MEALLRPFLHHPNQLGAGTLRLIGGQKHERADGQAQGSLPVEVVAFARLLEKARQAAIDLDGLAQEH